MFKAEELANWVTKKPKLYRHKRANDDWKLFEKPFYCNFLLLVINFVNIIKKKS